jgi:hypothetical protein
MNGVSNMLVFVARSLLLLLLVSGCIQPKTEDEIIASSVSAAVYNENTTGPKLVTKKISGKELATILQTDVENQINDPTYLLEFKNFRPGDLYTFYQLNVIGNKYYLGEYVITEKGNLFSIKNGEFHEFFIHRFGEFINGEPAYFAMVSGDKNSCIASVITPNPIEFKWEDGAYVCLVMETLDASRFVLTGKGFKPNEQLIAKSESCDSQLTNVLNASADGTIVVNINATVMNEIGGRASITIQRYEPDSQIGILKYLWGADAMNHSAINRNEKKVTSNQKITI